MNQREFSHVIAAIIIFTVISSFPSLIKKDYGSIPLYFLFSAIIISIAIVSKKIIAYSLDANVKHQIWAAKRFGYRPHWHLKNDIPAGIIFPLVLSVFSIGFLKFPALLTYETSALKHRAAKRFGYYSFTEMTEWHNALIGAAGIVSALAISVVSYLIGVEYLTKLSAYYAFSNLIPISRLDGTQIFFGSKILYITLSVVTLIFFLFALFI